MYLSTLLCLTLSSSTDSDFLGKSPWEVPIGRVIEGMDVIDSLNGQYGDIVPFGKGPDQQLIWREGNEYLHREFPKLDYFLGCSLISLGPVEMPKVVTKESAAVIGEGALPQRPPLSTLTIILVMGATVSSLLLLYKINDKKSDRKSIV